MNILLSYSKAHYDETKKPEEQEYWGSSASVLARSLYEILSTIGSVTYIDRGDFHTIKGKEFDLFVGIQENFTTILSLATIKKSILFAVNMHPYERNSILKNFMRSANITNSDLAGYEITAMWDMTGAIEKADHILCVGNTTTYNSYIKHGVAKEKIKMLNYAAMEQGESTSPLPRTAKKHYVHVGSEIGIRKGFDIITELFTNPSFVKNDFHLDIIGKITSPFYEKKMAFLKESLGDKVTYHGWVDSATPAYAALLKRSDFLVYPALEEGQAGSVLETIQHGVIPLLSKESGVDFSPLGNFTASIKSTKNKDILAQSFASTDEEIAHLKEKTIEYYKEFHSPFKKLLAQSIGDSINDTLYPKVSIVISIFNKEKTIVPLLQHVYNACTVYKNTELQIIFDGCVDKSEELVKNFFSDKPEQSVAYHKTNNIWEVKSNNLGLQSATGRYTIILQDDNFIYDEDFIFEAVSFLEKNPTAVVLGGLAGVFFYPRNTILPANIKGQHTMNTNEVYWRQDAETDPTLINKIFEVDTCMRGPLILRKSFLEKHGYLDEAYCPLYNDDMDLCFRAKSLGYKTYCMLMDVENKNGTIANYSEEKARFFDEVMKKNSDLLYSRWTPSVTKQYLQITRTPIEKKFFSEYKIEKIARKITAPFVFIHHQTLSKTKTVTQLIKKHGFYEGLKQVAQKTRQKIKKMLNV